MLYGLITLLIVIALVLFLAKIAVAGGIVGILALVILVWLVVGGGARRV